MSPDLTLHLLLARACCDQPACQLWSFYLHPLWRYERQYKVWKMGWFGVVI